MPRPFLSVDTRLTQKQEQFCIALVEGKTASDAYRQAFRPLAARPATIASEANRLKYLPHIARYIEKLKAPVIAKARKKFKYELEDAMRECEEAASLARAMLQPNVMVQATTLKAKLMLKLGEPASRQNTPLDEASTEELIQLLKRLREERAAGAAYKELQTPAPVMASHE